MGIFNLFKKKAKPKIKNISTSTREVSPDMYQILCTYDINTCDSCAKMDGKFFNTTDAKVGINHPPFHNKCRCTTVPYFEDDNDLCDKWCRNPITGKSDSTYSQNYNEWINELCDKYGKDKILELRSNSLSRIKNLPVSKPKKVTPQEMQVPELHKPKNEISTGVSSWNISISFGRSTSSNYAKAVFLAKKSSSTYFEDGEGKDIIHQATYTSATNDYLAFIKLYELVGAWKSSFVFINGEMIDRKIVGKLNYCYGDKCRSGNNSFCYGASEFTTNPFGCHRLQVSEHNNPWWSFGMLDTKGIWHVDKSGILNRINQYYTPYKNCPSFSYEKIIFNLDSLPNTINPKKDENWEINGDKIYPRNFGITNIIKLNDI